MSLEMWKDISGYEGKYQVSTWGRVRSINGILKPYVNSKGYEKVGLMKNGKSNKHRVSRLVAEAFIPNPYNLPQVDHIDGNKRNNSITNLEWVTGNENISRYYAMRGLCFPEGVGDGRSDNH
jgi:hypothetical protein